MDKILTALTDLYEAVPKQTNDADWWPDELTKAMGQAALILDETQPNLQTQREGVDVNNFPVTNELKYELACLLVANMAQMGIDITDYQQDEFQHHFSEDFIDSVLDAVLTWQAKQSPETQPVQRRGEEESIEDYKEVIADHKRLVRELDVIINGENAAPQASLCDIVSQLAKEYKKL
jgi:hypothetical protein